jgi:hypothetical protein
VDGDRRVQLRDDAAVLGDLGAVTLAMCEVAGHHDERGTKTVGGGDRLREVLGLLLEPRVRRDESELRVGHLDEEERLLIRRRLCQPTSREQQRDRKAGDPLAPGHESPDREFLLTALS